MRLSEIHNIEEGGASGGARYNSEVAFLYRIAGDKKFNPKKPSSSMDMSMFADPKRTATEIDKFLVPNYNAKIFDAWEHLADAYMDAIEQREGSRPEKLGWAGGSNINDDGVADVVFYNFPAAGVSIKDTGGITLANLTPRNIGLEPDRGRDVFSHLAQKEFDAMKKAIFTDVLNDAMSKPDQPQNYGGTRQIVYNSQTQDFTVDGKQKSITATADQIMAQIGNNANWQRVFGDWFQQNWQAKKEYAAPLYKKVARLIELQLENALGDNEKLQRILQFADQPYYYATTKGLYLVPSIEEAGDLQLKRVYYGEPDGTSQKFIAEIGHPDNPKNAQVTVYIRYANGMFESNPTVRVQDLKNPENLAWEKIV